MKKKPELLSPAGDFEKLKVAFHFGADAVYAGLTDFSLRAKTKNFNDDELRQAIDYTHSINKKIYITMNIYFTPDETESLIERLKFIENIKPDGLILSDLGAVYLAKKYAPGIPIHISTQANITNQFAALYLKETGASRIILARELTLTQIKKIKEQTDITLEAFIHGAMCIAYSGRCLLSAFMTHPELGKRSDIESDEIRSANKGNCSHSCRWEYILKEKTRGEQEYSILENENGTYVFSSKDICMIDNIKDLINAGIDSFKIEGRMKSILYISSIVRAYRQAIDHLYDKNTEYNRDEIEEELNVVSHREFCTGFFYEKPCDNPNTTKGGLYKRNKRLGALVADIKSGRAVLKIYNTITKNDTLQYIAPKMKTVKISKIILYDENNNEIDNAKHNQYIEAVIYDDKNNIIKPDLFDIIRMDAEF